METLFASPVGNLLAPLTIRVPSIPTLPRRAARKRRTQGVYTFPRPGQTTVVVKFIGSHRWQAWETSATSTVGLPITEPVEYFNLKDAKAAFSIV